MAALMSTRFPVRVLAVLLLVPGCLFPSVPVASAGDAPCGGKPRGEAQDHRGRREYVQSNIAAQQLQSTFHHSVCVFLS